MCKGSALTRLSTAMATAADGNGRVLIDDLRRLGFDDDTLRRHGPDAVRLTMHRDVTTISLELVTSK